MSQATYESDVKFLKKHTNIIELTAGDGRVALAPEYQGRVMTSGLAGEGSASFGWVNQDFIAAGAEDVHFNNYGGEDRFWLGPEAGQFALWFKQGESFDLDYWKTPAAFGSGAFEVAGQDSQKLSLSARFDVTNYSGFTFKCGVKRTISMLDREKAAKLLGSAIAPELNMVAFESDNELTNEGPAAWQRDTGLVSIWTLGQFKGKPGGVVIIPFHPGDEAAMGARATTDYFGELPAERCKVADDHLLFCCDGQWRSKVGISAGRAKSVLGSYDPGAGVLTIVQFSLPKDCAELAYVNSRWEIQDTPFIGDVINAYSDGPGSGHDTNADPFYEMETSSPAAELSPGGSITHCHRTFHFAGGDEAMSELSRQALGLDLGAIN